MVKNLPASAGDRRAAGSVPESGRSLGGGNSNSLQYSCGGNPMGRGAWRAVVHGVTESDMTEACTHASRWPSGKESACKCRRCWFRRSPDQEDALEEMATLSSILARKTPWRGVWRATVDGVTESRTRLDD